MAEELELSTQSFRFLAKAAGLDIGDPHMEKLHAYLKEVLPRMQGAEEKRPASEGEKDLHTLIQRYMPKLRRISELDLSGLDPAMIVRPLEGRKDD
jgi:hypothetical protein